MDDPSLNRAGCGDEGLPGNLSAEYPLTHIVRALTSKYALFDPFEVKQSDQIVDRSLCCRAIAHRSSMGVDRNRNETPRR